MSVRKAAKVAWSPREYRPSHRPDEDLTGKVRRYAIGPSLQGALSSPVARAAIESRATVIRLWVLALVMARHIFRNPSAKFARVIGSNLRLLNRVLFRQPSRLSRFLSDRHGAAW
jgi:hypothetical protein